MVLLGCPAGFVGFGESAGSERVKKNRTHAHTLILYSSASTIPSHVLFPLFFSLPFRSHFPVIKYESWYYVLVMSNSC
jgi:hypothetical protein